MAFDLDTFLDLAARTRKWQCPHSMQPGAVQDLVVDGFVQRVLASLRVILPRSFVGFSNNGCGARASQD